MSKAFLDTTILADALLKPGETEVTTKAALRRYDTTELPVYAIKEFKAGPFNNFIWFYNKLALTNSFYDALKALHGMSLTPKRHTTATAIEALMASAHMTRTLTGDDMVDRYGEPAKLDRFLSDQFRLSLRTRIAFAWRRRRNVASQVVIPLSCYTEKAPFEEDGILKSGPLKCNPQPECCLATALKSRPNDLKKLKKIIDRQPDKPENRRRAQVLRDLFRTPKRLMTEEMCRALGDAFFALFAPDDAVILTTNVRDHEPLANALGKSVETP
jgi:hypothetical protein